MIGTYCMSETEEVFHKYISDVEIYIEMAGPTPKNL